MELSVDVVRQLIMALDKSGIGRLDLECENFKISLGRDRVPAAPTAPAVSAAAAVPAVSAVPADSAPELLCGHVVTAPIVGTYYSSPSPDKAPFVRVGSKVKCGDTLFIIESMKLMNEITSEFDGTVAEILLETGSGVEYGQPVMRIE